MIIYQIQAALKFRPRLRKKAPKENGQSSMITALLPVKRFDRSKERLAGFLSASERVELARTMFLDVWTVLNQLLASKQLDRLLVISAEPCVLAQCRRDGIEFVEESVQQSHSESVISATRYALATGTRTLLSVPIDTPGVRPDEILSLLQLRYEYRVVIVPSADGTGSNALLRTPPDAIAPHFGPGSCELHAREAAANGHSCLVHQCAGFAADIDTPEDLRVFAALERPCRTLQLVRSYLGVDRGVTSCL